MRPCAISFCQQRVVKLLEEFEKLFLMPPVRLVVVLHDIGFIWIGCGRSLRRPAAESVSNATRSRVAEGQFAHEELPTGLSAWPRSHAVKAARIGPMRDIMQKNRRYFVDTNAFRSALHGTPLPGPERTRRPPLHFAPPHHPRGPGRKWQLEYVASRTSSTSAFRSNTRATQIVGDSVGEACGIKGALRSP